MLNKHGEENGQTDKDTIKQVASLRQMKEQAPTLFRHYLSALY